jgi:putative phage-type endonuclease
VIMQRNELDERIQSEQLTGIGSSDAAAILGVSPWSSPFRVWERLTGAAVDEPEPQLAWRVGQELEGFMARLYAEQTGRKVRRDYQHHRSRAHPFMVTHLDFKVLGERRLLECKTASYKSDSWGEPGSAEIPVHYYCQVQHEMAVTGYEITDVPVMFGFRTFHVYTVERNAQFIAELVDAEETFWREHVETRVPPPVDGSDHARQFMQRRWPSDDGFMLPATPEQVELVERLRLAEANAKATARAAEELRNRIIEVIGPNTGLRGPDFEITYKATKEGKPGVNWEAVAHSLRKIVEELPELQRAVVEELRLPPETPLDDALDVLKSLYAVPGRKSYRRWDMKDREVTE